MRGVESCSRANHGMQRSKLKISFCIDEIFSNGEHCRDSRFLSALEDLGSIRIEDLIAQMCMGIYQGIHASKHIRFSSEFFEFRVALIAWKL
jgi:hypothetical protein